MPHIHSFECSFESKFVEIISHHKERKNFIKPKETSQVSNNHYLYIEIKIDSKIWANQSS